MDNEENWSKKEERYYDLTKYLAATSLTLIALLFAAKQSKVFAEEQIGDVFFLIAFVLAFTFSLSLFFATYIVKNGLSSFWRNTYCALVV
jgi:hypothetical protein